MKKVYLKDMSAKDIIELLKNGKEIKYENINLITKMVDGVICDFEGNGEYIIGSPLKSEHRNFSYFEYEEPFEITETGFYKTRCGQKVYVSTTHSISYSPVHGCVENTDYSFYWKKDGKVYENKTSKNDIVAKWED